MKLKPEIIHEDDDLVLVNKPSGWLSIPDRSGETRNCISAFLKNSRKEIYNVHRIDRDTSGILVYAKNAKAHQHLNLQFFNRSVKKTYHALLVGDIASAKQTEFPLEKTTRGLVKVSNSGKAAKSHFEPIERFGSWTFCEVTITTGRTHQIRVHAAHIGHPLVGDSLYGDEKPLDIYQIKRIPHQGNDDRRALISRVALHAHRLVFVHPASGATMDAIAEHPKDFKATLNQLRKWRNRIVK